MWSDIGLRNTLLRNTVVVQRLDRLWTICTPLIWTSLGFWITGMDNWEITFNLVNGLRPQIFGVGAYYITFDAGYGVQCDPMQPLHARCSRATSRPMRMKFTKRSLKISARSNSLVLRFTAGLCDTPNKSAYAQCRPDDEVESFNLSQDSAIVYRDVLWTLGSETNGSTHCGWIGLGDYHLC